MRQYSAKVRKNLHGYSENEIIERIVYNKGRSYQFDTFEHWFDDKDRLKQDYIYDCNIGMLKINWKDYGNNSPARDYRWFLNRETYFGNNNHIYENDDSSYLGSYAHMQSPGVITMYIDNIQVFFWSIICELSCVHKYIFTREQIEELAYLCICKTLYHELFHHFIDVVKHIVDGHIYNFDIDESLAVASSRLLVGYESKNNHSYVSDFLRLAYSYESKGYKDWINFKSEEQFFLRLNDYIPINPILKLKGQELMPITEGMLFSIIEHPNVMVQIQ